MPSGVISASGSGVLPRKPSDLAEILADFKAGIGVTDGEILNSSSWRADPRQVDHRVDDD